MTLKYAQMEATDTRTSLPSVPHVAESSDADVRFFFHGDVTVIDYSAGSFILSRLLSSLMTTPQETIELPREIIEREFRNLADWWREATQFLSSPTEIAHHEAYQRIVGLGPRVVPFILKDLRDNGGDWYIALRRLVSDPPQITQEMARSTQRVIDAWLAWGRQHGYRV